ncbi:DUF202 domain-containing protein [Arthrobacter koreensis]|uniref:DUF202 domain-containing protein n=1 Tax=Arthrobacter koreensis TaxID=199136 RepID=UPI002DB77CB6|nr:DUF202 domain-containing protein [Arthrobacter koreensis]MEB7504938.1 DUF202 domain-containing protein [Arthrobacter koreensis]
MSCRTRAGQRLSKAPGTRLAAFPPGPRHTDAGLQPERTVLSWGRTLLSFYISAALFLRWLPAHGVWILVLFGMAAGAGAAIQITQRARYARQSWGLTDESIRADLKGVVSITVASVALGMASIFMVLFSVQ